MFRSGWGLVRRRGGERNLGLTFTPYVDVASCSVSRATVLSGVLTARGDARPTDARRVSVVGILDIIVEFGMGLGEWFFGDGREKFFEGHACEPDAGIGQGPIGIILRVGFSSGFGFLGFAHFKELFGDAHFGHELGGFGAGTVPHETEFGFHFVKGFGREAGAFIGEELFVDVGPFGPFPEFFFFLIGGVGLGEGEPVALDLEVIVGEGGVAEAGDVVGELVESVPFEFGIGFGIDVASHGDVLELGPEEEFVGEGGGGEGGRLGGGCWMLDTGFGNGCRGGDRGRGGGRERGRIQQEVGCVILEEPVAVAALFPFGEVLFGDGVVVEMLRRNGFGFEEGVEPGEDLFGGEAVEEFEVELFADGVREATDFADARSSVHMIHDLVLGRSVGRGVGQKLSNRKSTEVLGKVTRVTWLHKLHREMTDSRML